VEAVQENKAAMRRIIEQVVNEQDLDAANDLFAHEHEVHPESPGIGRGPEGMKQAFAGLHEQFPDVVVTLESMVAEEDTVAVRLTYRGTDAATGERAQPVRHRGGCAGPFAAATRVVAFPAAAGGRSPRPTTSCWSKDGPTSLDNLVHREGHPSDPAFRDTVRGPHV
jgi:predicted SnoaL-like aldol condensation-catalyzing enzyme